MIYVVEVVVVLCGEIVVDVGDFVYVWLCGEWY